MGIDIKISFTAEYLKTYEGADDYRNLASPQVVNETTDKSIKYQQVFEEKHSFMPNISIIDLLFCEGPHAKQLLTAE
jgi:hypothetical protein